MGRKAAGGREVPEEQDVLRHRQLKTLPGCPNTKAFTVAFQVCGSVRQTITFGNSDALGEEWRRKVK